MQTFKVISLDMFQTLVNIQGRRAASSAARKYTAEDFSKYSCNMAWTMIALRQ